MPTVADAATLPLTLDEILIVVDFLLVVVVVGLIACVLGCLASFAAVLFAEDHRDTGHPQGGLVALVLALLAVPGAADAQVETQDASEVVRPRFTRVFGSDSVRISADPESVVDDRSIAVSPDGRWIAWTNDGPDGSDILVVATRGGEPVEVSGAHEFNANPVWFPDSRRLAFRSGSATFGPFIYTVRLDPATGRPVETPRQVSLEAPRQYGFGVSPDGAQIAYVAARDEGRRALRVVPSSGGSARSLWEARAPVWWPAWSQNGDSVYVITGETPVDGPRVVRRLPARGGAGEVVHEWEDGVLHALSPDGRFVSRRVSAGPGRTFWELATLDGRTLARYALPEHMVLAGFWPGEPAMVAAATDVAAPLRLLPVRGGPARQLTETRAYDVPLRWMPGGEEVFVRTQLDGEVVYMLESVDGGATRAVALPEPAWRGTPPALSDDGRYVVWLTGEDTEPPVLKLFDVQNETVRDVTDAPCRPTQLPPTWEGDRFLYCGKDGTRHEYRASTPDGASRPLLAYEADAASWPGIGVRGNRIAYTENHGEEGSLLLARGADPKARRLITLPGAIGAKGMQGPVWSPDGRALVVGYARPGAEDVEALVVRVSDGADLVGEPTILELQDGPAWWWDPQWLPDGSAFVTGGMYPNLDTGIWLVSLDPETDPEELTADDPSPVWHFALSPDGRSIVYSGERPSGASFWKVEFTEMTGSRR